MICYRIDSAHVQEICLLADWLVVATRIKLGGHRQALCVKSQRRVVAWQQSLPGRIPLATDSVVTGVSSPAWGIRQR
jgi:hypothetical protein